MWAVATNEPIATVSEVFVVYNSSYATDSNSDGVQDSLEIANYYKTVRSIPDANVVGVAMPITEVISRSDYNTYIRSGIEVALQNAGLKDTIKYIVLTKGVPLKIYSTNGLANNYEDLNCDCASVDSSITLLYQDYDITAQISNGYYNVDNNNLTHRFKTNTFANANDETIQYLVTRLDGYTVANIKSMIDRAYNADTSGSGYYVISGYNTRSFSYLPGNTVTRLVALSKNVHPYPYSSTSAITTAPGSVIGYTGYGTHAGLGNDYYNNTLGFSYLNGAVAATYESFAAFSMTSPDTTGHGQVAQFIQAGGSGGIGSVYEPYSIGIGIPEIWMPAYSAGYTWAEAAYLSLQYIDWQSIVIGDPLMRINIDINTPTVTTGASSSVGESTVTLAGEITATGGANSTARGFEYGLTTAYGEISTSSGSYSTGAFTANLTNLICNTTYHYRAFATNSTAKGVGSDSTFTTSSCVNPGVNIADASSVASTTATLNAEILDTGTSTVTARGFNIGTTTSYGTNIGTTGTYTAGAFTGSATSLSCNTTYHFRAYATNTSGTAYSPDNTFTTTACAPTITTGSSESITASTATVNASITAMGGAHASVRGIQYGTSVSYGSTANESGTFSNTDFSINLSSLSCNTTYHYRAYATNSGGTSYGSDSTFTTSICPVTPTVSTVSSSVLSKTSVTLTGTLTDYGNENNTAHGFNYGTTDSYGTTSTTSGNFTHILGFLSKFGEAGIGNVQFNEPRDVAVDSSGNIYVADRGNHRIQKFDSSGAFVTEWGSFGTGNSQFKYPRGIAVDSSGNIYVADSDNFKVKKFDSSGTYITSWGGYGTGNGKLSYPQDVTITNDGVSVYASDYDNYRVTKFSNTGTYSIKWGSAGSGNSQFNPPYGLAINSSGNVYVVDKGNVRIKVFDSNGTYITQFGATGVANGEFNMPTGIAIDSSDNIYVTDATLDKVQKFDSNHNYVTSFGSTGTGDGELDGPESITIDSNGDFYVADTGNNRIQKFAGSGTFTATITGLSCGTTYHYRAYSTNSAGNGYGSDDTFTTQACDAPTVTTSTASSVSTTTVTLNGSISAIGVSGPTVRGFNYGTTDSYGTTTTDTTGAPFSTGDFSANITGLTCNTTYHYRAYATNSDGTATGSDATFTTSACPVSSSGGGGGGGGSSRKLLPLVPVVKPVEITIPMTTVQNFYKSSSLRTGTRGQNVVTLQTFLKAQGPDVFPTTAKIDGVFGRMTDQAVKKFQTKNNLKPDGVVGAKTKAAIDALNTKKYCYAVLQPTKKC